MLIGMIVVLVRRREIILALENQLFFLLRIIEIRRIKVSFQWHHFLLRRIAHLPHLYFTLDRRHIRTLHLRSHRKPPEHLLLLLPHLPLLSLMILNEVLPLLRGTRPGHPLEISFHVAQVKPVYL